MFLLPQYAQSLQDKAEAEMWEAIFAQERADLEEMNPSDSTYWAQEIAQHDLVLI